MYVYHGYSIQKAQADCQMKKLVLMKMAAFCRQIDSTIVLLLYVHSVGSIRKENRPIFRKPRNQNCSNWNLTNPGMTNFRNQQRALPKWMNSWLIEKKINVMYWRRTETPKNLSMWFSNDQLTLLLQLTNRKFWGWRG